MHVPIPPTHRTGSGAQIRPRCLKYRLSERQPPGGVSDERREDISPPERLAQRYAQCLLSTAQKNPAMDFASAIKTGKLFIQDTGLEHQAERFDVIVPNCGEFGGCF